VLDAPAALAAHSPPSLDEPISEDSQPVTLGDLLSGGDGGVERAEHAVLVEHYLAQLPPRNREVLRLRFQQDLKQREIGALLGISEMHVSRLIRQSLERLQAVAAEGSIDAAAGQLSAGDHCQRQRTTPQATLTRPALRHALLFAGVRLPSDASAPGAHEDGSRRSPAEGAGPARTPAAPALPRLSARSERGAPPPLRSRRSRRAR